VELPDLVMPTLPSFPWRTVLYGGVALLGGVVLFHIVTHRRS
jgi:hypothetical protein